MYWHFVNDFLFTCMYKCIILVRVSSDFLDSLVSVYLIH